MKKGRLLVAIFIIAVLVLYVIIYIIPKMSGMLEDTTVLKYGSLPVTDNAEALLVRDETLFISAAEGNMKYKVDESSKVRKGTVIVELDRAQTVKREKDASGKEIEPASQYADILKRSGDNVKVSESNASNISGVISYHVDGYEKILTPEKIDDLDGDAIKDIKNDVENVKRDTTLKGDPIYKTTDNTVWYMAIWKKKDESIKDYEDNTGLKVNIGNTQIDAVVDSISEKADGYLIVLKTDMYYKNFAKYRKVDISVVFAEYQGLIVENRSIVNEDDISYVYVKQTDGTYKRTQIKILATSGGYSVLSVKSFYDENGNEIKTVNYYEELLVDPEDYKGED